MFAACRYNFPAHTGNLISPALFKRLTHDFPLVRGIKNVRLPVFPSLPRLQLMGLK